MTAIDLLNALKAYTEDKTKDMRLIARVPENGTDPGERPPLVFIGNLPNKEQERKQHPTYFLNYLPKRQMMKRMYAGCVLFALHFRKIKTKIICNA